MTKQTTPKRPKADPHEIARSIVVAQTTTGDAERSPVDHSRPAEATAPAASSCLP